MFNEFSVSKSDLYKGLINLIQSTRMAIDPSFTIRLYQIRNFFRDLDIIGEEGYTFSHNFWYKDKISIIYYSQKYNSCLNVLLDKENIEWYWIPSELSRLFNNDEWPMTTYFPTVLDSREDNIKGLIKFAKIASKNRKYIKVAEDGSMYFDGVFEWIDNILNTIKDSTIGSSTDRFSNMFKNADAFKAVPYNSLDIQKSQDDFTLVSVNYALSILEETLVEKHKNQLVQDSQFSNSSDCFVVTATFGTPYAKEVIKYRNFRDNYLSKYFIGRTFIDLYNVWGPKLAAIVKKNPKLKLAMAKLLGTGSQILPEVQHNNLK